MKRMLKKVFLLWFLLTGMTPFLFACGNGDVATPPIPPSPSLDTWHIRNSWPQGDHLHAVTYGNGLFVAAGDNGTIVTSPDGVTWTPRSSGINNQLNGIAYGNGLYVAVGENGRILASPDGMAWTDRSTLQPFLPFLTEITFGNGIFIASGIFAPNIYSYTSPDSVTWTSGPAGIHAITFNNREFLAVQTFPSVHGYYGWSQTIFISTDGAAWKQVSTPNWPFDISQMAHGKDLYVGVGGTSIDPALVTSSDGVAWTERNPQTSELLYAVTYGGGFFVAVGNNGTILISSDGISWINKRQDLTDSLSSVTYGNSTFVAVGSDGIILQSDPL